MTGNIRVAVGQVSECHRHLVRTGLGACVAHLIRVGGMATASGRIGVGITVYHVGDHSARGSAVNINIRSSLPGEVHRISPLQFVTTRT